MKHSKNLISLFSLSLLCTYTLLSGCSSTDQRTTTDLSKESAEQEDVLEPAEYLVLDYAEKQDENMVFNLDLYVLNGQFSDDFSSGQIEFGQDLSEASQICIDEINEEKNIASLSFILPAQGLDEDNLDLNAGLVLKGGAIIDSSDNPIDEIEITQEIKSGGDRAENIFSKTFYDPQTLILQFQSDNITAIDTFSTLMEAMNSFTYRDIENMPYLILDFTSCNNIPGDVSYAIFNVVYSLLPQTYIINAGTSSNLYQSFQNAGIRFAEKVKFLSGNTSGLDYSSSDIYRTITEKIDSGQFKVIGDFTD
jgi:hypothetical protein